MTGNQFGDAMQTSMQGRVEERFAGAINPKQETRRAMRGKRVRTREYETMWGITLQLHPVRSVAIELARMRVAERFRREGQPIDPPAYDLDASKVLGGQETIDEMMKVEPEKYVLFYDPETGDNNIEVPGDHERTARNWAKWQAHQDALHALAVTQASETQQELYALGIEFDEAEWDEYSDHQLRRILERDGQEMPTDPDDLKFARLWFVILGDAEKQMVEAILQVMSQGVFEAEDLDVFQETLRSTMGRAARETIESIAGRFRDSTEGVVAELETFADEGGESLESAPEPMG